MENVQTLNLISLYSLVQFNAKKRLHSENDHALNLTTKIAVREHKFLLTGNGNQRYKKSYVTCSQVLLTSQKLSYFKRDLFVRFSEKYFNSPLKIECSLRRYPFDPSFAITFEINRKKIDKIAFVNSIAKFLYYVTLQTRFNGTWTFSTG